MDKTAQTELHRRFLIERLPEPLTPASSHLQIFDNYIEGTAIRLRKVRDPHTKAWTRMMQKRFRIGDGPNTMTKLAEIHLDEDEYSYFAHFEGREIRKNRYFHEFDGLMVEFDVFLGELWGLQMAKVGFASVEKLQDFEPPQFAVVEVTGDQFFDGRSLVDARFSDVQKKVSRNAVRPD